MDYTVVLTLIAAELTRIANALEAGNADFDAFKTLFTTFQQDINVLKVRGSDNGTGIVVTSPDEELDRAVLMNALKQGNQLQNVIKEVSNPTQIPGL